MWDLECGKWDVRGRARIPGLSKHWPAHMLPDAIGGCTPVEDGARSQPHHAFYPSVEMH